MQAQRGTDREVERRGTFLRANLDAGAEGRRTAWSSGEGRSYARTWMQAQRKTDREVERRGTFLRANLDAGAAGETDREVERGGTFLRANLDAAG
jgi:hypothetical protein